MSKNKKKNSSKKSLGWNEGLSKIAERHGIPLDKPEPVNQKTVHWEKKQMEHIRKIEPGREARAPYNFVPLNDNVVPAEEMPGEGKLAFDVYHNDKNTGCIELAITTKTPLYIRDTLTEKEMEEKAEIESDPKKKYINPDFFSPAGKKRIPGSSLRGMVRSLVEIVSFANYGFFEKDRKYHFRTFADKSLDLRKKYKEKILCGDRSNGFSQQVKAGYLVKAGPNFKIKPAQTINSCQFFRVEEDLVIKKGVLTATEQMNKKITVKDKISNKNKEIYIDNKKYEMGFKKVKFTYAPPDKHTSHSVPLYYAKVSDICNEKETLTGSTGGALVYSGWMRGPKKRPRGKHLHWVIGPATNNINDTKKLHENVIEDYKKDVDRHKEANLLRYFESNPSIEVPCFYIEEKGKVISFGHTGIFRLAYERKLKDFLPKSMKDFKGIDISEAMFGNETSFAGRVFFEDAELCNDEGNNEQTSEIPCVLAAPKPTTFQHYLVQHKPIQLKDDNFNGIQDYNDNTWLRGNKLYWHKSGNGWKEDTITFSDNDFFDLLRKHRETKDHFNGKINERKEDKKIDVNLSSLTVNQRKIILDAIGIYETQHTKIRPVKKDVVFTGSIRFENLSKVELGALLFALNLPNGCCHKLGMGKPLGLGSIKIEPKLYISNREKRYKELFAEWGEEIKPESEEEINKLKKEFANYILREVDNAKVSDKAEEAIVNLWEIPRMVELKTMLGYKKIPDDKKTEYMKLPEFKERRVLPLPTEVK